MKKENNDLEFLIMNQLHEFQIDFNAEKENPPEIRRAIKNNWARQIIAIVQNDVWDKQRADESVQVTFQYWVKWKKDGVLFDECQVNWVDLRASATQLVYSFKTHRTVDQLMHFEETVIDRVIDGIELEAWS